MDVSVRQGSALGWVWAGLLAVLVGAGMSAGAQQIAFTFDDLPAHGPLPPGETRIQVADKVIKALKKAHMPPTYGFVNGIAGSRSIRRRRRCWRRGGRRGIRWEITPGRT
jgi:peptidoglycan/xylan/chitin deacetylase (PgdA/CDA1 family)